MERWLLAEPYWKACRNTGYIRMHELAAKEVYGVNGISRETIETLSKLFAVKDASTSYAEGMERARILCGIADSDFKCDRRFLRPAFRMEEFVERIDLRTVRKQLGTSIHTFIDWLDACDETIRRYVQAGAVVFKTTIATDRSLNIGHGSYAEAEQSFLNAMREDNGYQPHLRLTRILCSGMCSAARRDMACLCRCTRVWLPATPISFPMAIPCSYARCLSSTAI